MSIILFILTSMPGAAQDGYPVMPKEDPSIRSAVDYLLGCQNPDGGFNNEPEMTTSSLRATANAAMALAWTGDLDRAVDGGKTPIAYLTANKPDDSASGGVLGRYVMGVVAAGGDPFDVGGTDHVDKLKNCAKAPYGDENLFSESYIFLGLIAAGESESPEVQDSVAYLKSKQYPNGGWGWGDLGPDVDTTGIVVCVLVGAGEDVDSQQIQDALDYLRDQQNPDGGFTSSGMGSATNSISDEWAIMAIYAGGENPKDWLKGANNPISHLLSCQQDSGVIWWTPDSPGGVGFLLENTAYGAISLTGGILPPVIFSPEAPEVAAVTIHVLGDGAPLFGGEVDVGSEDFTKDGYTIHNPTALGALEETAVAYTLGGPQSGPEVTDLSGFGSPVYYVNGVTPDVPMGEYNLTGDECITVSAPDSILPMYLKAPTDVITGDDFRIEVYTTTRDDKGELTTVPVEGATVTVESDTSAQTYTTDKDGLTQELSLNQEGKYRAKAELEGYISTYYLMCGYHIISCQEGEPVPVTVHVLGNGAPLFSSEVDVGTAGFTKDGYEIDNPTAMGALQETGVSYTLGDPWGMGSPAVTDLAGFGMPVYYVDGAMPPEGLDKCKLSGGEWITVSAPYTVTPLFMDAPDEVDIGKVFHIKVETEEYDASWNLIRVPVEGATVTVGTEIYTTSADGFTPYITLNLAGDYNTKAEKAGYIGTYYLIPGGYHVIHCTEDVVKTVTIHVLGNGAPLFSGEVDVGTAGFTKDGYDIDNPTAMGALDLTSVSYTLGDPWGMGSPAVTDLAGLGMPVYYVDGSMPLVGLDQYYLSGGEWITVSAPYTLPPLYLDAPDEVDIGKVFHIKVETEEYDASWNLVRVPVEGATVTLEFDPNSPYTTDANGLVSVTLDQTGIYNTKAEKAGYIGTYYRIPGGYHVIHCTEDVVKTVTIHVLGNGAPLFSGEVDVGTAGFTKDGYDIDNPTAMGALELTGVSYTLGDPWGMGSPAVTDLAGFGMPVYYVDGSMPLVGLDQYYLSGGEWITVSAPYTVPPLYLDAPGDVKKGETFQIKVESEEYDASWNLVRVPVPGATVTLESDPNSPYTTNSDGLVSVTLDQTGFYNTKAEKAGYIGTYYLSGYHVIKCTAESGRFNVTKIADKSSVLPGDLLTYIITICNGEDGPVTEVKVNDSFEEDVEYITADPLPDSKGDNWQNWNFSEIASGECQDITLFVRVPETTELDSVIHNCVNVLAWNGSEWIEADACEEVSVGKSSELLGVAKTANKDKVDRGKKVNYTIKVCNWDNAPMTNVVVEDVFSRDVKFLSASPSPSGGNYDQERTDLIIWRFDEIGAGQCKEINLQVRALEMQDFKFGMEQGIEGEGFVNVVNDYSTSPPRYVLENCVNVTAHDGAGKAVSASDCANVLVTDPGTELRTREHGSGDYESDELINLQTENKSIEMFKDVSAEYKTTTLGLYRNRSITYSSRWTQDACAKNRITPASMHESYKYATNIDRDSYMMLDEKGSVMEVDSEFEGQGHIGYLSMAPKKTYPKDTPLFESREDYTGSFKVLEKIDGYGSSVASEKSATGEGFVVADKRIENKQRTYEWGTGIYESDELIETQTKYIAKDINLTYRPTSFKYTEDASIDQCLKWKEGMWSKDFNKSKNSTIISYIGEEFTSITRLEKDTIARGLGDMATEAEFSGNARFRAIMANKSLNTSGNNSRKGVQPMVDMDETYLGDYSIKRRVAITGPYKYNQPHLTINKSGELVYLDESTLARYEIIIENDGNRALGPVYIRDLFPPKTQFINSSARPSLTSTSANWTLVHLGIGDTETITLWLNVTEYQGDELVNRAEASGGYNGGWATASGFSSIEINWLKCCQERTISAVKTAELDPERSNVVWYTLEVQNLGESTQVAEVRDVLPQNMLLLDSSVAPSSYESNQITWNLVDLAPGETETILFSAEALRSGRFVNLAEVNAVSVDGAVSRTAYANAVVDIDEFEGEMPVYGWQPPDWGFEYIGYPTNLTCGEICELGYEGASKETAAELKTAKETAIQEPQELQEPLTTAGDYTETMADASTISGLVDETPYVNSAVEYLLSCQNEGGGFGPKPGSKSNIHSTAIAVMALASSGEDPANYAVDGETPLDYLVENADVLSTSSNIEAHTGRYVVALVAGGADPHDISGTDYVDVLKSYSRPSGEIGKENYIWDDAWVVLGLAASGEPGSNEVSGAVEYLKSVQTESGGWAWHGGSGGADPDTTGIVVCALMAAGEDIASGPVQKALDYFKSEQNEDGGFSSLGSNSATDDWVIMALSAAGQDPRKWRVGTADPITHLTSLQKDDGAIWWKEESEGTSFQWTAYGVVAITGGRIPPVIFT
ncbi:MAG: prenyltransferase/squalene oxidase repeat-containing protein [Euryarchaeota archaeon]|nr:prenyltransferase/squalene oxidase repeat-containing protein [Euryarchaeota archaeon]